MRYHCQRKRVFRAVFSSDQSTSLDQQHAVIERSSLDGSVYIRDLCTKNGTFVNNLPIRNTTVKLKSGDQLRFGCEPTVYEFQLTHEMDGVAMGWTLGPLPANIFVAKLERSTLSRTIEGVAHCDRYMDDVSCMTDRKHGIQQILTLFSEAHPSLEFTVEAATNNILAFLDVAVPRKEDGSDQLIERLQVEIARLSPLAAVNAQKDIIIQHMQQQLAQLSAHKLCPNSIERNFENQNAGMTGSGRCNDEYDLGEPIRCNVDSSSRTRPVSASSLLFPKPVTDGSDEVRNRVEDKDKDGIVNAALFERIRKERQILSGLVTQLQRDLANKDTNLGRLTQEMNSLKRQLNEKDIALNVSHKKLLKAQDTTAFQKEREELEKEIGTIRQKYKTAELRAQGLREELDKSENERAALQNDLIESKAQQQSMEKILRETKAQLDELQRSERTALLEKKEVTSQYERLRNRIMRTVFSALAKIDKLDHTDDHLAGTNRPVPNAADPADQVCKDIVRDTSNNAITEEQDDNNILDRLNVLVEEYFKSHRKLVAIAKASKEQDRREQGLAIELDDFLDQLSEMQGNATESPRIRSPTQVRSQLDLICTYVPKSKQLRRLQEALSQCWKEELSNTQRIADCLQEASSAVAAVCPDSTISLTSHPHDPITGIRRLAEFGMAIQAKREALQKELENCKRFHHEELERIKDTQRKELQHRVEEALEVNNEEHANKLRQTINEVVRIENERQEQLIAVKQAIIEELELKLRETRQMLAERQTTHEGELQLLRDEAKNTDQLESDLGTQKTLCIELREQLEAANKTVEKIRAETEKECEEKWRKEVESHREQAKQHARTICVMEERLVKLTKQIKESKAEVTRMKRQQTELQTEHKQLQLRLTEAQQKLVSTRRTSPPSSGDQHKSSSSAPDRSATGNHSDGLQTELLGLRGLLNERDTTIAMLRADLDGAKAQLSDLRGELSEAQKEEIECALDFGKKANAELSSTRARLTQVNDMLTGLRQKLMDKETELRNQSVQLDELRATLEQREQTSNQLARLLDEERAARARDVDKLNNTSKLTEELASVGAECRGERHLEIIAKQRDALSQMRQRLREHPSFGDISSPEDQNRQVANLRREVAELRSQTLLSEVLPALRATNSGRTPALEGGSIPTDTDSGMETSLMDRNSLRGAMDALHNSEECYLNLSRSIARQLDVDNLPGQRSLIHVPAVERQLVQRERAQALGILSQRIAVLREQVQRKSDMLSNYEHDMGKLRQAEVLAEGRSEQIGRMVADLRAKETEIQLLRQSLDRTREALVNEQRMVSAIRKTKHPIPAQLVDSKGTVDRKKQPHCPPNDSLAKVRQLRGEY
ncbi:unnamed protein product [Echinostoma caproni]|uniref:FHA domain-containing protein n=1 Tax=Echinostoma caproni TaxID=27848 RepID=A0A183ADM6_9TREM|nr:unnamed protein product [Echinostoma caproni]